MRPETSSAPPLRLFHVQDGDIPMHVVAPDWAGAIARWEQHVRAEGDVPAEEAIDPPQGIALVADADDLLLPPPTGASNAARDIAAERERQMAEEGYDAAHDDEHRDGRIVLAAADLLMHVYKAALPPEGQAVLPDPDDDWGLAAKHKDARRRLVIAGALIAAEIDRLDRAAAAQEPR